MEYGYSKMSHGGNEATEGSCCRCAGDSRQAHSLGTHQPSDLGYISLASDVGDDERLSSPSPCGHMEHKDRLILTNQLGSHKEPAGTSAHCGPHSSRRWKKPVAKMRRKMRQVSESLANKFKSQDLISPRIVLHKRKPSSSAPTSALIKGKRTRAQADPDTPDDVSSFPTDVHDAPTCSAWHRRQQVTAGPVLGDACTTAKMDFASIYDCYRIDRTSKESVSNRHMADSSPHDDICNDTIQTGLEYGIRAHVPSSHGRCSKPCCANDNDDDSTRAMISAFLKSQRQTLSYQDRLREAEVNKLEMKIELKIQELENVMKEQISKVTEEASRSMQTNAVLDQVSCASLTGTALASSAYSWLPIRHHKPWAHVKSTTAPGQAYNKSPLGIGKENIEQNSDDYAYKPQSPEITRQLEQVLYQTISDKS